eukprot:TRINITY_DN2818_c0_g1::TRINITY_DN2818_c0_g1_i2::g.5525::m.5525 TRINITY_DN2818_c0_g1::TRINITY_DN2818_c0_g1_i2::g.5525  ORF type:complete len:122 (+),score=-4.72,Med27/PF11571.3/6.2,Med27/PF11571.3/16 TRINITY_DN2818_c0_g1_i2:1281-1646(+)
MKIPPILSMLRPPPILLDSQIRRLSIYHSRCLVYSCYNYCAAPAPTATSVTCFSELSPFLTVTSVIFFFWLVLPCISTRRHYRIFEDNFSCYSLLSQIIFLPPICIHSDARASAIESIRPP